MYKILFYKQLQQRWRPWMAKKSLPSLDDVTTKALQDVKATIDNTPVEEIRKALIERGEWQVLSSTEMSHAKKGRYNKFDLESTASHHVQKLLGPWFFIKLINYSGDYVETDHTVMLKCDLSHIVDCDYN